MHGSRSFRAIQVIPCNSGAGGLMSPVQVAILIRTLATPKKESPMKTCIMILLIVAAAPVAMASPCMPLPDFDLSIAMFRDSADHSYPLSLMIVPDGSGEPLAEAQRPDGTVVNGQIIVYLLDGWARGREDMPPAEILLESPGGILAFCTDGNMAGQATDSEGYTYFSAPLYGGGWSQNDLRVYVCNTPLSSAYLPLWINSPDIDGDLEVNLSDVQLFAVDFYGAYAYRSDLFYDGVINLSDLSRLAQHLEADCN